MSRRTYSYNAFSSQLASPITSESSSITLASTTGLTAPCYLVIEPDSLTKREYIKVLSITAPTLENVTRGLSGSVAANQAHDSGVEVRAVMTHQILDDIFLDVINLETSTQEHYGGTDTADHPEADASKRGFMSSDDYNKLDNIDEGAEVNPTGTEILALLEPVGGADSGLDADLLDGVHGSGYATAGHDHDSDYAADDHDHTGLGVVVGVDADAVSGGMIGMTTSFVAKASATFDKPAGWNSYDIHIVGGASMHADGVTTGLQARIQSGGSIRVVDTNSGDTVTVFADRTLTGQTASSLVCDIQVAEEYGQGLYASSFVQFTAVRKT